MSESHFVRQARTLFPTIKTNSEPSESESEYVVARALYFYVQAKIPQQSWDEIARVFNFLTDCCSQDPGLWLENATATLETRVRSYLGINDTLGDEFWEELNLFISQAAANPQRFHFQARDRRRVNLKRFPSRCCRTIRFAASRDEEDSSSKSL